MTKKHLTIEEASIAAERAYRRGFQQGIRFAEMGVTDKDAYEYRYNFEISKAWGAPEKWADGTIRPAHPIFSLEERLRMENKDIFKV